MKTNNKITLDDVMKAKEVESTMSELEKSVRKDIIAFVNTRAGVCSYHYLTNSKYWTDIYWKERLEDV